MVTIKPGKYGFGPNGNPELGVPPGVTIEYEVEIKDFVKVWFCGSYDKSNQFLISKTGSLDNAIQEFLLA